MLDVKIKILREGITIPEYATAGSAAVDLRSAAESAVTIEPGQIAAIPTGIAISSGRGDVVALLFGRSGLGAKYGVTLANGVGVIDSDYRGEIQAVLINRGSAAYPVQPGERVAQLMFTTALAARFTEVKELDDTARGEGGFGSTGRA